MFFNLGYTIAILFDTLVLDYFLLLLIPYFEGVIIVRRSSCSRSEIILVRVGVGWMMVKAAVLGFG